MSTQPFPTRAEHLRQYELCIDLHKHYLKLTIELNIFYYAITGALVSYYLVNSTQPLMRWALILPLLMSGFFAALFIYGGVQQSALRQEVFRLRDTLQFHAAPDLVVLSIFLYMLAGLMIVIAAALFSLVICPSLIT
jgi:hypothetical protein